MLRARTRDTLLRDIRAHLAVLGYTLEREQPHISGERELLSTHKMVLLAKNEKEEKVVVKVSWDKFGTLEVKREKTARDILKKLSFAGDELLQAEERYYGKRGSYLFLITAFVDQDEIYVEKPLEEQFFIALRAFEAQEAFHATTYEHAREIRKHFATYTPDIYLKQFARFIDDIARGYGDEALHDALRRAYALLKEHRDVLLRYGNYLTHNDFVPHNMRLQGRSLYVLDHTSFWFGNKYEGWARFLNYMLVHNPALERLLVTYVRDNRSQEYLDLRLMRIYKVGMLLSYYVRLLPRTHGDLSDLTRLRIDLWAQVLEYMLNDAPVPDSLVTSYIERRNTLRTEEEKQRQREFAIA